MKVDYYLGVEPDHTTRMLLQGHFYRWYHAVEPYIDTRIISIPNGGDLLARIKRKTLRSSGLPLLLSRRQDSLMHIISVNLVNRAISTLARSPLVVTCFDAVIYEEVAKQLANSYPEAILASHKRIIRKADRVITISEHARGRIAEVCDISAEKIDVAYLAVDHDMFYPRNFEGATESLCRVGFEPTRKNILYVGSESPRKNLARLIQALPLVRKELDIRFVKVGVPREPYHSQLQELVYQLDLGDVVHFHGPVEMEHLPLVYSMADVFVFPSLYEGFGLPVLEAMASGCAVVTSNMTSLPEVAGDAAEMVDPYDPQSIASGILRVLSDETYRRHLIQKGREQALKFSWERTAMRMLDIYRTVI